ncbi:MAG: 2OG-Fe(II) oxygenase [Myxococcota bacterium]
MPRGAAERSVSNPSPSRPVERIDWAEVEAQLDARGHALPGRLLAARECDALRRLFRDDTRFRSSVDMEKHRFGRGRYRYFAYPLPRTVEALREALYAPLAAIANRWQERLGRDERFEPTLAAFLARCHAEGQTRPTPLLLHYVAGDYNRLHQDLYGRVAFPLQVTIALSREGAEYSGGEFLLTEQRPRMQVRGHAVRLALGEAIVFPNAVRPVASSRGWSRAQVRHGVSELLSGERTTLGLIFHDAK